MGSTVICIGAVLVDELFFCNKDVLIATSNPATLMRNPGGVAHNIARNLASLDINVQLFAAIGNDPDGDWLNNECIKNGIRTNLIKRVNAFTGKYASILNSDGSLFCAVCSDPCTPYINKEALEEQIGDLENAEMIIGDTNLSIETISWLASFCKKSGIRLIVEPVSIEKARKLSAIDLSGIYMITPNEDELFSLCKKQHLDSKAAIDELLMRGSENVWLRKGDKGSEIFNIDGTIMLNVPSIPVLDSTGAGDAALAGWVAAQLNGLSSLQCLRAGHAMALETLQFYGAVIPGFSYENLLSSIKKYYPDEK